MFPEASVAVTVTVFAPKSEHPKLLGETLNVTLEQLSVAELTSCAVDKLAEPLASSTRVTGAVDNASEGAVLSCTTTVIVVVELFPDASTLVMVIVFEPTSAQLKLVALYVKLGAPEQLSAAEAMLNGKLTAPLEPNVNVIDAGAVMVGAVLSTTVTVLVAVLTLPEASVAVIVMVLLPRSLQSKLVALNVTVGVAVQLSVTLATTSL